MPCLIDISARPFLFRRETEEERMGVRGLDKEAGDLETGKILKYERINNKTKLLLLTLV